MEDNSFLYLFPYCLIRLGCTIYQREDTKFLITLITLSHLTIQLFSDQIFLRAEITLCNLLFPVGCYSNTFGLNEEEIPCTFPCLFQIFIEHLLCSRYWNIAVNNRLSWLFFPKKQNIIFKELFPGPLRVGRFFLMKLVSTLGCIKWEKS